jgi:GH15 family glucan-1,4-alpha-glucosidase
LAASHDEDRTQASGPLRRVDGHLAIEDHGLIGDGTTAGLVGRDGAIPWLCVPRFDAPPLFCRILDLERGGAVTVAPTELVASGQRYEPGTGVLVTEMRAPGGLLRLTDALTIRKGADLAEDVSAGRGELLRSARVLDGRVELLIEIEPRRGEVTRQGGNELVIRDPRGDVQVWGSQSLQGRRTIRVLEAGEELHLVLRWGSCSRRRPTVSPPELLDATLEAWRRWEKRIEFDGPQEALVRRSAITLKLLDHFANGAIVAAPTSSLPEAIGGPRNWDYRYSWIRDAAFSVYALRRVGLSDEAWGFLAWVLDAVERQGRPRVLYDLDGKQPPPEREDPELEGYRRSRPVRWGNAAADQVQHDVYGEVLDCAYQWAMRGGKLDASLWARLQSLVEAALEEWGSPDHGIWEVRTTARPFTYSAALCQVALDRGTRLAERFGLPAPIRRWRAAATEIARVILERAWDPEQDSLTEHLGGGGLDASLLSLPLRRVVRADHPRMVATTEAIRQRLGAGDGLLYRYLPEESPDGLPGPEGAFLLCSFWLVDNLAGQGRLEEAAELFDSLCARANPLGLLPEQIDPVSGAFLGNFPQAVSHVGLISTAVNLARKAAKPGTRSAR